MEYFRFLIDAVGYQVSPIITLCCKPLLTKILKCNLSRLPYDCIFYLYTSMHGVTVFYFFGFYIRKFWLLNIRLIYFKITFSLSFFTSSGNLVTSYKFLGSGMKWYTSDPNSPGELNELFIYFTKTLNTLCEHFPILFMIALLPSTHFVISLFGHLFSIWNLLF